MRASTTAFLTGILSGTNKKKRLDEADAERNRQLDLAASAQAQREQAQKANEALSLLSFLGKTGASGQGMADTVAGQLGLQSPGDASGRSEEHTSELQSHSFISYAVFCLKKKNKKKNTRTHV